MEDVGRFSIKMSGFSPSSNNSTNPGVEPLLSRFSAAHRTNMVSFAAAAALAKVNYMEKSSKNLFENVSVEQTEDEIDDDDDDDEGTIIDVGQISPKRESVEQICPKDENFVRVSGADSSSEKQNLVSSWTINNLIDSLLIISIALKIR